MLAEKWLAVEFTTALYAKYFSAFNVTAKLVTIQVLKDLNHSYIDCPMCGRKLKSPIAEMRFAL